MRSAQPRLRPPTRCLRNATYRSLCSSRGADDMRLLVSYSVVL